MTIVKIITFSNNSWLGTRPGEQHVPTKHVETFVILQLSLKLIVHTGVSFKRCSSRRNYPTTLCLYWRTPDSSSVQQSTQFFYLSESKK